MRAKGVTYDTGFINAGVSTREQFDSKIVEREMRVIREDLHCNAVRITGGDPQRIELAATFAVHAGLEVWFSPFTCDLSTDELRRLLLECAERAEKLRAHGANVVFVAGAELSLFTIGFLPGNKLEERLSLLKEPQKLREYLAALPSRINRFFASTVPLVRERFGGKITYASIFSERVDWTPFDYVSVDMYRSADIAARFRDGIHELVSQSKPVAITEIGCATFRGAADRGSSAGMIVVYKDNVPVGLDSDYVRDEAEQANCLRDLLGILDAEGVDSVFVNTFASYHLPHRPNARGDLDMASYGLVKVLERMEDRHGDVPWEPKAAFAAVANFFRG